MVVGSNTLPRSRDGRGEAVVTIRALPYRMDGVISMHELKMPASCGSLIFCVGMLIPELQPIVADVSASTFNLISRHSG
jgi:hypothetical protein